MFIDIHCHVENYSNEELNKIVNNALKNNVELIVNSGTYIKSNRRSLEISKKFKEIEATIGIYPVNILKMPDKDIDKEINFIKKNEKNIIGIGEVGFEFKQVSKETFEKQKKGFRKFIKLAQKLDKPIIIHSRKGEKEAIELLEEMKAKKVIMHCFFGSQKLVKRIIKNNWYFTVPTCVCYNNQMQELVKMVPINRIFCETDSPYMHPKREKINQPANVIEGYKKIAKIKRISLGKLEKQIEQNYKKLFT